ncbi:MAG: radical SAM protein [Bacillota bacterium]
MAAVKFEQGPIRPPSEAGSLLLRLTRNCPWNRCLFCPVYKKEQFSRRDIEEIKNDIFAIVEAAEEVKAVSEANGFNGDINRQVVAKLQSQRPELLQVAFWLYRGGENVFLQDGDSLLLPVEQLSEILGLLTEKFPSIKRITTYARSKTLLKHNIEDLRILKNAGLNRIHVGLESGNDQVLKFMKKGVTGEEQIKAGQRVKKAGLSLSEYVILGLGGEQRWREHALDTAESLNYINPDFIRVRTLAVPHVSPLYQKILQGEFKLLSDDDIVREEKLFIENLQGIDSEFYSDHILNLLEDVRGKLPGDKSKMLGVINKYLSMSTEKREKFQLGRRTGYYRTMSDMQCSNFTDPVESNYRQLQQKGISVDEYVKQLMLRFI